MPRAKVKKGDIILALQKYQITYNSAYPASKLVEIFRAHIPNCKCPPQPSISIRSSSSQSGTSYEPRDPIPILSDTSHQPSSTNNYNWPPEPLSEIAKQSLFTQYQDFSSIITTSFVCAICVERVFRDHPLFSPITLLDYPSSPFIVSSTLLSSEYQVSIGSKLYLLYCSSYNAETGMIQLCEPCNLLIQKKQVPMFGVCHQVNWILSPPSHLPKLTMAKNDLISVAKLGCNVIRLTTMRSGSQAQYAIRGNVIFVPQNPLPLRHYLPPSSLELKKTFVVVFEPSTSTLSAEEILRKYRPLRVRRDVVANYLHWLVTNNPLYASIQISSESLQSLPEDGVLTDVTSIIHESSRLLPSSMQWAQGTAEGGGQHSNGDESSIIEAAIDQGGIFEGSTAGGIQVSAGTFPSDPDYLSAIRDVLVHGEKYLKVKSSKTLADSTSLDSLKGSFPYLFPYGTSLGIDNNSFDHSKLFRHLHRHVDSRFRDDTRWMFAAFNILQKQFTFRYARLSIRREDHGKLKDLLTHVPLKNVDLLLQHWKSPSLPLPPEIDSNQVLIMKQVMNLFSKTAKSIPCSNGAKDDRRIEIRSCFIRFGLPAFFITIAPTDYLNPLTQSYISDDHPFLVENGLSFQNAVRNPASCAWGFHSLCQNFIETVLKIDKGGKSLGESMFGKVTCFFGTVESQGNGTLHLHCLVWIAGIDRPKVVLDRLENDHTYRSKFLAFADRSISVQIASPQISVLPRLSSLLTSVFNPNMPSSEREEFILNLAKSTCVHIRHNATCYKYCKAGETPICRFFPERLLPNESTLWDGTQIIYKRQDGLGGFTERYTPDLLFMLRCSLNSQFTFSGDVFGAAYYIAKYITKGTIIMHELVTLVKKVLCRKIRLAPRDEFSEETNSVRILSSLLLNMVSNQEVCAPMVASYLDGYSDYITTGKFTPLYLYSFYNFLNSVCPSSFRLDQDYQTPAFDTVSFGSDSIQYVFSTLCDDYRFRPLGFSHICLYQFVMHFRKQKSTGNSTKPFLSGHPQYKTHRLSEIKSSVLPILHIQPIHTLPASDDYSAIERFYRFLLLLFKPWRTFGDLVGDHDSWKLSFDSTTFPPEIQIIVDNTFDFSSSRLAKKRDRTIQTLLEGEQHVSPQIILSTLTEEGDIPIFDIPDDLDDVNDTDMTIALLGQNFNLFGSSPPVFTHIYSSDDIIEQQQKWIHYQEEENIRRKQLLLSIDTDIEMDYIDIDPALITSFYPTPQPTIDLSIPIHITSGLAKSICDEFTLDSIQREPVLELVKSIENPHLGQIRMIVSGPGGTGKSQIIRCIQTIFQRTKNFNQLRTMAYTGSASSLIEGSTFHSLILGSRHSKKQSSNISSLMKKQDLWKLAIAVLVDEVSMVSARMLYCIDRNLRELLGKSEPFGGLHIIFFRDFAQLPPVGEHALYDDRIARIVDYNPDSGFIQGNERIQEQMLGRAIWLSVNRTVCLKTIHRQKDPIYRDLLNRLRWGCCTKTDYSLLETRILSDLANTHLNPLKWADAILITRLKSTRDVWNKFKCEGATKYASIDRCKRLDSHVLKNQLLRLVRETPPRYCLDFDDFTGLLPLFVGQRIMILKNIAVSLGITNGATGTVQSIYADNHPTLPNTLHATGILVKLDIIVARGTGYPGLDTGVVYIPTITQSTNVSIPNTNHRFVVYRTQLPVIPAYAMTSYKSQGRSMDSAILHIDTPMKRSAYSAATQHTYVMFSRIRSLDGLLILNSFPESAVSTHLRQDCRDELLRLHEPYPDISSDNFRSRRAKRKHGSDFIT